MPKPYRIRIEDHLGNVTYITRTDKGRVSYFNGIETPLALANLLQTQAAEVRFKLEDAVNGSAAFKVLNHALDQLWVNPKARPQTKLLI